MTYLLDTHTLLWALSETSKLTDTVKGILTDDQNCIVISTVSFWEISLKFSIGKLISTTGMPESFPQICIDAGFKIEDICAQLTSTFHGLTATHHKDPFDRMLIWQSLSRDYTLISNDSDIKKYTSEGLQVIW